MHELGRVIDVLDGVEGLGLFEDVGSRDALGGGELRHSVGFDEVIVGRASGHDDVWSYTGFVLTDAFQDAFALFGGGGAIGAGGCAEDDDGVEVGLGGVVGGERFVVDRDDEGQGEDDQDNDNKGSIEEPHAGRVSGMVCS
jgi:hypothetical protein